MATISEVVAAVVVHSSAVAFSHFGVILESKQIERPQPAAERVIARTPARKQKMSIVKTPASSGSPADCPEQQALRPIKA